MIIQSYLTYDSTNSISRKINFNANMIFKINIPQNWSFDKSFLKVNKDFFGLTSKKIYSRFDLYKIGL